VVDVPRGEWALAKSGCALPNDDGTLERLQPRRLPGWGVPKRNPMREGREIAELAAKRGDAAGGDIAA
jgi:hypothetical protein